MKKWTGYESTEVMGDFRTLDTGAHKLNIIGAKIEERSGFEIFIVAFDITAGSGKGFYKEQYDNNTKANKKWMGTYDIFLPKDNGSEQDERNKKQLKAFIEIVEKNNAGFKWNWDNDELLAKSLKGKMFGGVFGQEEYVNGNGETKLSTKIRWACDINKLDSQKIPKLKKANGGSNAIMSPMPNTEDDSEELPF